MGERTQVRRVVAVLALAIAAGVLMSPAPAPASPCGPGVTAEVRDGRVLCHHPDQAPPGVDLDERPSTDELTVRRYGQEGEPLYAAAGAGDVACIGDGSDGDRVQAIYARASDVPDRFAAVAGLIAQYAADADYQINVSAALSGAGRRIRYVTENCRLDISNVTLSPSGDNSFGATRNELKAKGFNRIDRKYLVWVDAAVGICGIAEMYSDDRDTASNWNNEGDMFARVDAPCWGYAEAHELLHTIGAVQDSAPNSTGAGHCTDEKDTMCYSDGSGDPMVSVCPTKASWHVDCNLDDYFNANPPAGSYLDTHWNSAASVYLEGAEPLPPPPSISLSAPTSFYAGTLVGVSATPKVPAGRTYTIAWTTTLAGCKFTVATGAASVFYCPATSVGSGQITATVVDSLGMSASASKTFKLKIPFLKRPTSAKLSASGKTLTGKVLDALTGKPVAGARVSMYYRRAGSSKWTKFTTRRTGASGTFSYKVNPSKSTYYKIVSLSNTTWASDWSPSKLVKIG